MAEASGSSAIYYGDDKKALSFDVAGDIMAVTVSGEGGDQSPMNGIYYRVVEEADTVAIKSDANIRKYANESSDVVGVVNAGAKVKKMYDPVPTLMIQDELHLIRESFWND